MKERATQLQSFQRAVRGHFDRHVRAMPWRQPEKGGQFDAYKILVSEIMLQQTAVSRVTPKFEAFIHDFPTIQDLAAAPLSAVLSAWNGLGYNRRAKYLHEAAKQLADEPQPWQPPDLIACKGIGENTAAAICVYAYNQPLPFIETNIRTVYIHHFFHDRSDVADSEIRPLVEATMDTDNPREWFWALMDYGSFLKNSVGNLSRRSRHYAKQSVFEGSKRQIRGRILKRLLAGSASLEVLRENIEDPRVDDVLADLLQEGLIVLTDGRYHVSD